MQKRFVIFGLAALAAISVLAYPLVDTMRSPDTSSPPGLLKVAVSDDYYPFGYISRTTGERMGFDVEMAKALCKQMKTECKYEYLPLNLILKKLRAREVDMAVADLGKSPERAKFLAFSDPYNRSLSFFITNVPELAHVSQVDPKKLRIGVLYDSLQHQRLMRDYASQGASIHAFRNHPDIVTALKKGDVNMWLTDGLPGYAVLKDPAHKDLHIAGNYPYNDPDITESRIVVPLDKKFMIPHINEALLQLKARGRYQELLHKYFPSIHY